MSLIGFKLFIGNLSKETHDTGLEKYFKDAIGGEIVWAQVCKDRNTGESKRYGFITFKDEADGKRAIEELHETELDGSKITVDRSTQGMIEKDGGGRGAEDENVRLFVGGLPDNCVEEDLMDLFKDCEPVEAFMCGSKHPPCGFVTIKRSNDNLEKAQSYDGIYFKDSKWRLAVKAAKPVKEREERGRSRSPPRGRGGRSRSPPRRSGPIYRGMEGGKEVRLFVGGLPEGCTDKDLMYKFRRSDPVEAFLPPRQSVAPLYGFVVVRDEGRNLKEAFALEGDYFDDRSPHRMAVTFSKPRGGGGGGGGGGGDRYAGSSGGYSRGRSPSPVYSRRRGRSPSPSDRHYRRGRSRSRSPYRSRSRGRRRSPY